MQQHSMSIWFNVLLAQIPQASNGFNAAFTYAYHEHVVSYTPEDKIKITKIQTKIAYVPERVVITILSAFTSSNNFEQQRY